MALTNGTTIEDGYSAADWTITVGGTPLAWTRCEFTFEQFHHPASFAIEAPFVATDLPATISDKPPLVVIKRRGQEFFRGQADTSQVAADPRTPEGLLTVSGRDLAARFILAKIDAEHMPPMNQTSSQILTGWARQLGLDPSGITATSTIVGDLVKNDTIHVTRGLDYYSVAYDLATYENFVFRVKGNTVFFGPLAKVPPRLTLALAYHRDFDRFTWRKSHANADVQVRVMGRQKRHKVSQTAGSGSILFERVILDQQLTPARAKAIADDLIVKIEAGLLMLDLTSMPGNPALDDILWSFDVSGIAKGSGTVKGIDGSYYPTRVHHVLTQEDHVMDLSLFSKPALFNDLALVA